MATAKAAVLPSGLLLGSKAINHVTPALSLTVNPGAAPSLLARMTVHVPFAGPSPVSGPRTASATLKWTRQDAVGEPTGIGHFVDRVDVLRARALRVAGVRELVQHQVIEKVDLPGGDLGGILRLRLHRKGIVTVILPLLGERRRSQAE